MDSEEDDDIEILFPPLELKIGTQVSVYWSDEDEFFNGEVERRHRRDKSKYLIQYDDGDAWWLDTCADQFSWPQSNDIKLPTMSERISVGSRVAVWWTKEKKYFYATVEEIREDDEKPHRLGYDDGDEEWTDLDFRKVYFLEEDEESCEDEDYNNKSKSRQKKDISNKAQSRKRKRNNEDVFTDAKSSTEMKNTKSSRATSVQNKDDDGKQKKCRTWNEQFQELKDFYQEHGHTNVERSHPTLGWFARKHKEISILAKLTDVQKGLLASINFDMRTREEKLNARWNASFMKLKEFKNKNGNTHVSQLQDVTLANRCKVQRRSKREGSLADNRVKSLEEIGFNFLTSTKEVKSNTGAVEPDRAECAAELENMIDDKNDKKSVQRTWEEYFQELKRFFEENGHSDITQSHPTLGRWVKEEIRRTSSRSKLSDEQKAMLESVKFDMRTHEEKLNDQWNESFMKLKKFKSEHGRIQVKESDDSCLAQWVSTQKRMRKAGSMRKHRKELLDEIDFEWN